MEIREEYRAKVEREFTETEKKMWDFKLNRHVPDVLAIKIPTADNVLYNHPLIDEEKEEFYSTTKGNYFAKKFQEVIQQEETWGTLYTEEGTVFVRPLEKRLYWKAKQVIKEKFVPESAFMSGFELIGDDGAMKDLDALLKEWITSGQSVAATNPKKKGSMYGVAVGRHNDGTLISKKISQVFGAGEKVSRFMKIRRYFQNRVTTCLNLWNKPYYQVHLIWVDENFPSYQGLVKSLVDGCLGVARQLNVAYVFCLSFEKLWDVAFLQSGFKLVASSPLSTWLTKDPSELVEEDELSQPESQGHDTSEDMINVFVKEIPYDPNRKWNFYKRIDD